MSDLPTYRLILEPSEELSRLKIENARLHSEILEIEREKTRAEYMMMCNSALYLELLDWAKVKGYKVPKRMQSVYGTDYMPAPKGDSP